MFLFFSFLDSHTNVIWAYVTISVCPAAQSFEAKTLILAYSEWLSEYDLSFAAWKPVDFRDFFTFIPVSVTDWMQGHRGMGKAKLNFFSSLCLLLSNQVLTLCYYCYWHEYCHAQNAFFWLCDFISSSLFIFRLYLCENLQTRISLVCQQESLLSCLVWLKTHPCTHNNMECLQRPFATSKKVMSLLQGLLRLETLHSTPLPHHPISA